MNTMLDQSHSMPQPTYAERARSWVQIGRVGSLATISVDHAGCPFGSVMPYAIDGHGNPLFLFGAKEIHTENVRREPRASLLMNFGADLAFPMPGLFGSSRVTLMGTVRPVAKTEVPDARQMFLTRHAAASAWVDNPEFGFYRMQVMHVCFVRGSFERGWATAEEYCQASPDPLIWDAPAITQHVNEQYANPLLKLTKLLTGQPARQATMTWVDRLGFDVCIDTGDCVREMRIAFPAEANNIAELRSIMARMLPVSSQGD